MTHAGEAGHPRISRRLATHGVAAALVTLTLLALGANVASAHVNGELTAVDAGVSTVALRWDHGCAGSPTVSLRIQVPEGATDIEASGPDGWAAAVADREVTVAGTPIADGTESTVTIRLKLTQPDGERVFFPTIQTCETGEEAWIETDDAGAQEPEDPAPAIVVGQTGTPSVSTHAQGPSPLLVTGVVAVVVLVAAGIVVAIRRFRSSSST